MSRARSAAPDAPHRTAEFRAVSVSYRYPGAGRPALEGVDLVAPAGIMTVVIGPNGSGKSTLLRLLLGADAPGRGEVSFAGRRVGAWDRRALARRVGVVQQSETVAFPLRVREYVAMGRYPHLGPWRAESDADRRAIGDAMERCDVGAFSDRPLGTLSGGERQRVRIARALSQEPDALVLDEPTAALDVRHEMAIFGLLRDLAREGRAVLLVTHSLNLSARLADRLLLLDEGRPAAMGAPRDVLERPVIERVYRWPVRIARHPGPGADSGAPQVVPLLVSPAAGPDASSARPDGSGSPPDDPGPRPAPTPGSTAPTDPDPPDR